MSEPVYYAIPVPDDLNRIVSVHDGFKWIRGVIPGTASIEDGNLSFLAHWQGGKRRFVMALEVVAGYSTDEN